MPPHEWLYEAYVVYDSTDADVKERIHQMSHSLSVYGVRTCVDLNPPGEVTSMRREVVNTTKAAIESTGLVLLCVTPALLAKAGASNNQCASIEIEAALSSAAQIVPVALHPSVRELGDWKMHAVGERLAARVAAGPIDVAGPENSGEAGAQLAAWKVFYELRERVKGKNKGGTPCMKLGDDATWDGGEEEAGDEDEGDDEDLGDRGPASHPPRRWTSEDLAAARARTVASLPAELRQQLQLPSVAAETQAARAKDSPAAVRSPARAALRERGAQWPSFGATAAKKAAAVAAAAAARVGGDEGYTRLGASCVPLYTLTADEVVKLLDKLGFGKYALSFRLAKVDGAKLSVMSARKLRVLGVHSESAQKRLQSVVGKLAKAGVPSSMLEASLVGTLWQSLIGGYAEPTTRDERFMDLVSARQREEETALYTPRGQSSNLGSAREPLQSSAYSLYGGGLAVSAGGFSMGGMGGMAMGGMGGMAMGGMDSLQLSPAYRPSVAEQLEQLRRQRLAEREAQRAQEEEEEDEEDDDEDGEGEGEGEGENEEDDDDAGAEEGEKEEEHSPGSERCDAQAVLTRPGGPTGDLGSHEIVRRPSGSRLVPITDGVDLLRVAGAPMPPSTPSVLGAGAPAEAASCSLAAMY